MSKKYLKILIPIIILSLLYIAITIWLSGNKFDEKIMDEDNTYLHAKYLSSKDCNGRLAGSTGNDNALEYVEDFFRENSIEPAGIDGSYYQPFSVIIPQIDTNPEFSLRSQNNEIIKEFTMYEDYKIVPSNNGGGIDYYGDMIFVGSNMLRIDPALIKDRIVVIFSNQIDNKKVQYVIDNGGKGILCGFERFAYGNRNRYELEKSINITGKTGESILVGYLSAETHSYFLQYMKDNNIEEGENYHGIIDNIRLKVDIGFPVVDTANILGKIPGKSSNGRTLLITANIDGSGEGTDDKYFAVASNASGMAALLEAARVIKNQENSPYESIVFVGFNAQEQQLSGSTYYVNNPLFPLNKTTVIHLENIGKVNREGLMISSDRINSTILKSKLTSYAKDLNLLTQKADFSYSAINQFADKKIMAVMISDYNYKGNNYDNTIETIDKVDLRNATNVLLEYVKRDIYKDVGFDYLIFWEKLFIWILIIGMVFNYILSRLYKANSNLMIGRISLEKIYYTTLISLFRKTYFYILPIIGSIFLLVFLVNINPESDIRVINNESITNFSMYLTVKTSLIYIRSLLNGNLQSISISLLEVIIMASARTLALISASLLLSTVIGILRGIYEGYKSKKGNLRYLSTLIVFSIPDVLIVLAGILLYIFISQNFPQVNEIIALNKFIIPLITLSVLPIIYISRITFITIEDEIKKDYIKNAKAKGASRRMIFAQELFPAIGFKIIDTLPAIMTILLSNMIIVEHLFNYKGIVYYLLYFFKRQDINGFIILALILGIIFIIFSWGIKFISKLVNPLKREENLK